MNRAEDTAVNARMDHLETALRLRLLVENDLTADRII
jgi:hypothetical protein